MKLKVQARLLQPGDKVGSGEVVENVWNGVYTPRGKIEMLLGKNDRTRTAQWGAYTMINVERE